MSDAKGPGHISWTDLTVRDATAVRDFYQAVVGWGSEAFSMGDYEDYCMTRPGDGETVAGICHARGGNAGLPAQWLIYLTVEDLDSSVRECESRGGKVLSGPRAQGSDGRICVIEDPAGAVCALYEQKTS